MHPRTRASRAPHPRPCPQRRTSSMRDPAARQRRMSSRSRPPRCGARAAPRDQSSTCIAAMFFIALQPPFSQATHVLRVPHSCTSTASNTNVASRALQSCNQPVPPPPL
jgi:hypothetical protein